MFNPKQLISQIQKNPELLELSLTRAYDQGRADEQQQKRTSQQNRALWLYFTLLSDELNAAGLTMEKVLKKGMELEWTPELIKSFIWKPTQKYLFQKESTTELDKHTEITKIWEHINRWLSEKFPGLPHIPFPSDPKKNEEYEKAQFGTDLEYKSHEGETAF